MRSQPEGSVATTTHLHPLQDLLARRRWTAAAFLQRVAARHQARGDGTIATRKEKVSRWIAGTVPEFSVQQAIADVLGINNDEILDRNWPDWLTLALCDDRIVEELPWTPAGTVEALEHLGGPVDRRGFLITSSTALAAILAQWNNAPAATAIPGRRIGADVADLFDLRLDALRRLDDRVGSAQTYSAARTELQLISQVLSNGSYTENIGRRLFTSAAEASRLAGWCAYDTGHHALAERHFITGLRAAASSGDATAGAIVLAFWGNLRYANGDPRGALDLLDGALATTSRISSPRVITLLHARTARAYSIGGQPKDSYRAIDAAFAAYDKAGPIVGDLPGMYWVTAGEVHQFAGSSALTLGEPHRALSQFDAAVSHPDPYDSTLETRGTMIYMARRAEAYLALGDLDATVETAQQILDMAAHVDSARAADSLGGLRDDLRAYEHVPVVRDFLGVYS
jgi:tetratricopeptide (TPR) repeat protein